ncbi:MAG TPA: AsmA family protein, partial [Halothiobacillus sp.]|nr:AsmA family protein [Halothiobacillus sp.]
DIQNSQIRYRDAINGQDITLNNLNLFAEELHLDRPVDFRLTTGVQLTEPALHSDIQLSGSLLFDITNGILSIHRPNLILSGKSDAPTLPKTFESKLDGESFQLAIESGELAARKLVLTAKATELANLTYVDLDLSTEVEGNFQAGQYALCDLQVRNRLRGLPTRTGELETKAEGNIRLDLTAGTASLLNWRIHSEPVTLTTSLNISHLFDGPHIQGPMAIAEFNPRTLAEVMQYTVPEMQDVNALTRFALNGQLDITPERAMLREVVIQLDDHRLEGEVGLADITSQHLQVSLSTDVLDANPYLPPEAEKTKPATATAAPRGFGGSQVERADDPIDLPVEMLRTLNADARLQINHLKFKEHDLRNLVLVFKARNGDLSLEQFDINAFEGQIKSKGRLDVRGDTPAWRFELDSRSIALQPLLMAVMNEDRLLGKGNLNLNINTVGNRPSALKSSLNGNLGFELRDGAIKGFNIAYALRKAQAQLKGQQEPPPEQLQTDFTAITGTATIRNGVLDNQDLQGASPLLRVEGAGTVDIARERLDYRAHVMVVDTTTGQEGRALEELRQIPIPVRITGSFQQPQIGIDLENILKDRVQQEIKRRVTEALEKRLLGNQPEDNGNEANEAMSDPIEQLRRLLPF